MNGVHVNLMRQTEYRYQGAVSGDFLVRVGAWGGGALLVLLLVMTVVNRQVSARQLSALQQTWVEMEPRYESVRSMQVELASHRAISGELNGWNSSRVDWHAYMERLPHVVPKDVQLTKLSVNSLFVMVPKPNADADHPGIPARRFNVRMEGKTAGDLADQVVVDFVETLRQGDLFNSVHKSIKLQGLQRSADTDEAKVHRMFGIEGESGERIME